MSALSTIAPAPSTTLRLGASPAQIAALAGIVVFLLAFLVVPLLRVIVIAFTAPDGGLTLVHFGDFFATGLLREAFWNSIYVAAMTVALASLIAVPLATFITRFRLRGSALIHTLHFGNFYREAAQAKTYLGFTNGRGPANTQIQIPLMDKNDGGRRSHYLTVQFSICDAPACGELIAAFGGATGGRPHHRIGDRYQDLASLGASFENPAGV